MVNNKRLYRWLKSGDIKGETESKVLAAQDQAIVRNYFKIDCKWRLCKQHEETIEHLNSGRPNFAKKEYVMRHDKVCAH
jgi:hypothetical protein